MLLSVAPVAAQNPLRVPGDCANLNDAVRTALSATSTAQGSCSRYTNAIILTGDISVTGSVRTISAGKMVSINGNGHTITGNNTDRLFFIESLGTLNLDDLTIAKAHILNRGTLNINNVVIKNANSAQSGAAIRTGPGGTGSTTIENSAFYNNNSSGSNSGAAIFVEGTTLTVRNSTFYNNQALQAGAIGVVNWGSGGTTNPANVKLYNNTFTDNTDRTTTAAEKGAFIQTGGSLDMRNNIFYGNNHNCHISTGVTINAASAKNIIGANRNSRCAGLADVTGDPQLASSATGNPPYYAIPAASPAVDAGTCISGITTDQRGASRPYPQGGNCDIGAYEYHPPPPTQVNNPPPQEPSGSPASEEDDKYMPPTISTCSTLAGILAFNITESSQCQRVDAMQIANPAIKDGDFVDAVDVWGWVTPNSEICFEASGSAIKFIDTAAMPRTVSDLSAFSRQDTVCASIDGPGILVLLPGDAPAAGSGQAQTASSASRKLSGCMVRLTEKLNFRETPGGEIMEVLSKDFKLTAEERTDDWFKVDFWGEKGWISAEWVAPEGDCG